MEFNSVIKRRKSTRTFRKKNASWKQILEAVDAAIQGPFAGNNNNIHFLITEDKKIIGRVSDFCEQKWISEASIVVLICSDDRHLENQYGERGRVFSRQQSGAATATFLLKLTELGLSSCWVGAYSDELIKQLFEIPQHIQIESIIPIGYEKPSVIKGKKRKKDLDNVLYWEMWKKDQRPPVFRDPSDERAFRSPATT
tara:strand:- start:17 stop:610 length:594 start_codon:yes stop_codon:yes gene_type:complete